MTTRAALGLAAWACITAAIGALAGCGGGLEEARAEPSSREDDELTAREWHDRVVRLEGEARLAADEGEDCGSRCAIAARACELGERICGLARADENDEGTRMLCEDARPRCAATRAAAAAGCECSP